MQPEPQTPVGNNADLPKKKLAIDKIRIVNNYICVVYLLECTVKYKLFCTVREYTFKQ